MTYVQRWIMHFIVSAYGSWSPRSAKCLISSTHFETFSLAYFSLKSSLPTQPRGGSVPYTSQSLAEHSLGNIKLRSILYNQYCFSRIGVPVNSHILVLSQPSVPPNIQLLLSPTNCSVFCIPHLRSWAFIKIVVKSANLTSFWYGFFYSFCQFRSLFTEIKGLNKNPTLSRKI